MKLLIYISFLLPVFCIANPSKTAPIKTEANVSTKEVMHSALNAIVKLVPYMSSELKFTDPNHQQDIEKYLIQVKEAFVNASHIKDLKSPNFEPSSQIIQEHLEETVTLFKNKNKTFARLRLSHTTSICISCHTQLPPEKVSSFTLGFKQVTKNHFDSSFEYAEYLYLIRDYTNALKNYDHAIKERLTNASNLKKIPNLINQHEFNDKTLNESIKKSLSIYLKIKKDVNAGLKFINNLLAYKNLTQYLKSDLKDWSRKLQPWKKVALPKTFSNEVEIKKFINEYLVPLETAESGMNEQEITLLIASGVLSNFLTQHPSSSLAPEILYWLGVSAHELNNNLFFDLGESYLKSCITHFPKSPIAPRCYMELEEQIIFGYSGSSGTQIPKDKENELKRYRALINLK
jgi:hypothetical protein